MVHGVIAPALGQSLGGYAGDAEGSQPFNLFELPDSDEGHGKGCVDLQLRSQCYQ